ncbi:hypothetical protein ASF98_21255 [Arthrobacter sp. Leaf337]|nr:hypothetical protein ASF98_21255 [Arthrobacter sp. Leaf337]
MQSAVILALSRSALSRGSPFDGAGIDRPSFLVSDEVDHDCVLDQVSGFGGGGWMVGTVVGLLPSLRSQARG